MTLVPSILDSLELEFKDIAKKNKFNILYDINKEKNMFWLCLWPQEYKDKPYNIRVFGKKTKRGWLLTEMGEFVDFLYDEFGEDLADLMDSVSIPDWFKIYTSQKGDQESFYCWTTDQKLLENILFFYYALLEIRQVLHDIDEELEDEE